MTTAALLMMVITNLVVTGVTIYFFYRVFKTPMPQNVDADEADYPRGG
jgi:Na+/H+ antiporter NhaD/arsenite permease-like protein